MLLLLRRFRNWSLAHKLKLGFIFTCSTKLLIQYRHITSIWWSSCVTSIRRTSRMTSIWRLVVVMSTSRRCVHRLGERLVFFFGLFKNRVRRVHIGFNILNSITFLRHPILRKVLSDGLSFNWWSHRVLTKLTVNGEDLLLLMKLSRKETRKVVLV